MASIFQSMGMSCSNSGYVGYPILLVAMPAIASTALALHMGRKARTRESAR
jgi:hypothetical protein